MTAPTSGHAIVKSAQLIAESTVTVYAVALESESNITLSDEVGTPVLPAPPDDVAQCAVSEVFHDHHTQYFAIFYYA